MSAEIIQLFDAKPVRFCSFCKTPEAKAKKFIASNVSSHCICGDCLVKAKEKINQSEGVTA